jgi:hypothetical protein
MLAAADAMLSWSLVLLQGSYTSANPSSAGTHDGGGVIDISVTNLTTTQRWETVRALRTVGFAAWLRNPSQGSWPYHIHAAAVSDPDLAPAARDQIHDYYFGKNGLANHAPRRHPDGLPGGVHLVGDVPQRLAIRYSGASQLTAGAHSGRRPPWFTSRC